MARRSGGLGLGGILVITGLLYYTGYGAQMLSTMQGFNQGCYGTVGGLSRAVASPLCKGVDVVVGGITTVADYVGDVLHSIDDTIGGVRGAAPRLSMDSIGSAFSGYASPSARLQQMMQGSPQQWFSGGDVSQRFQRAVGGGGEAAFGADRVVDVGQHRVHGAGDVGVVAQVVRLHSLDDLAGFLRGVRRVQIDH